MLKDLMATSYSDKIIYTLLVVSVVFVLAYFLRRLANKIIPDLKKRHQTRKSVFYGALFFVVLLCFQIWTTNLPSFTTILSFVSAGLIVALHECVLSFFGWLLILIKRPYEVGERIQIGEIKGDVIDIGIFHTLMIEVGNWVDADQSTGRIVSLTNSSVFKLPFYNYTKEFRYIWNEFPVMITFESDFNKAREILLSTAQDNASEIQATVKDLIEKMSHHYMVHYSKLTPVVYTKIAESGVVLTLRYLVDARKRRTSEDVISRKLLESFAATENIEFAYPTTRFFTSPDTKV